MKALFKAVWESGWVLFICGAVGLCIGATIGAAGAWSQAQGRYRAADRAADLCMHGNANACRVFEVEHQ